MEHDEEKDIFNAVINGDIESVKTYIASGESLNIQDENGGSLIHYAAMYGHIDIIISLSQSGAPLNYFFNGFSPLCLAIFFKKIESFWELVKQGADIHAATNDVNPLFMAAQKGEEEIVDFLINQRVELRPIRISAQALTENAEHESSFFKKSIKQLKEEKLAAGESQESITIYPEEIASALNYHSIAAKLHNFKDSLSHPEQEFIPPLIHFIWLGGNIPKNYLRSILGVAEIAKKSGFSVRIWVENEKHYRNTLNEIKSSFMTAQIAVSDEKLDQALGIELHYFSELKSRMQGKKADDFYCGLDNKFPLDQENRAELFWKYVDLERIGSKNLAAATDLLRLEIVRQQGGFYFDTDTQFVEINPPFKPKKPQYKSLNKEDKDFTKNKLFNKRLKQEYNQKKRQYTHYLRIYENNEHLRNYFLFRQENPVLGIKVHGSFFDGKVIDSHWNNDILGALPNHEVLRQTIIISLKNYQTMEKTLYDKTRKPFEVPSDATIMDIKRVPTAPKKKNLFTYSRREITIETAGPAALREAVRQFIENNDARQIQTIRFEIPGNHKLYVLGTEVISTCDNTWLQKQKLTGHYLESLPGTFFSYPNKKMDEEFTNSYQDYMDSEDDLDNVSSKNNSKKI